MLRPGQAPEPASETMPRGRQRSSNPTIPAHIDPAKVPKGIWWDRRWYVREVQPDGSTRKVTVARADARLSDLHVIAEQRAGRVARGTLAFVAEQFEGSLEFAGLAKSTQKDYRYCRAVACSYQLRNGMTLGLIEVSRLTIPAIQRLVEKIATGEPATAARPAVAGRPAKANHVLRYLRRLFAWGIRFGHCTINPAQGVRQADEVGADKMPTPEAFARVLAFAREAARLPAHTQGSAPPYLPAAMVLAHGCRLRGVEVHALTDAHDVGNGIRCNRVKGSRDNITLWEPALREAWDELVQVRRAADERRFARKQAKAGAAPAAAVGVVELLPKVRPLIVNQSGGPLAKSSLETAWQRLMERAIEAGVITRAERFTLHGLKHRGITDTVGTRADKQDAAGHVTPEMTHRYDHALPAVAAAPLPKVVGQVLGQPSNIKGLPGSQWDKSGA